MNAALCVVAGLLIVLSGLSNLGVLSPDDGPLHWGLSEVLAIVQIATGPVFFVLAIRQVRGNRS